MSSPEELEQKVQEEINEEETLSLPLEEVPEGEIKLNSELTRDELFTKIVERIFDEVISFRVEESLEYSKELLIKEEIKSILDNELV